MDKQNEGQISISDLAASVSNAFSADNTLKTTSRSNKWA
jgi:hypothetical protein